MNYKQLILILLTLTTCAWAQDGWHVVAGGSSSIPVGELAAWFKPDAGVTIGYGHPGQRGWQVEGRLEADRYSKENLKGYTADAVSLELEHIGLMINGRRLLTGTPQLGLFINLGAGPHYWKGTRSAIQADSSMGVPFIEEKVLEEGNWAARLGTGLEWRPIPALGIETSLDFRFVVGSLWPTMQPNIELEGVSGFSTLNPSLRIRYYF